MGHRKYLGEFEHLVLLAVAHLGDRGYGLGIRREIERRTGRSVSIGAVYATLERLEGKGHVSSWEGEATPRRGGRAKRHYRLQPAGARALLMARHAIDRMWEGLELPPGLERA